MQPPSCSTTRCICWAVNSTGARVSIVSAVPAGEVMAREDVLGISKPQAATIGTTSSVVRLPGKPPMQCLSATTGASHCRRCPAWTMAMVSAAVSARSSRLPEHAVISVASSMSEYAPAAMSLTMAVIASLPKGRP